MDKSKDYQNLDRYQDVLGQLPILQSYIHLLLSFAMPENVPRETIIQDLEAAIKTVKEKVPWMAGKVINVGKTAGNSGVYKVVACQPPENAIYVKDVSHKLPPYAEIKRRKLPTSLCDAELLAPCSGFPTPVVDSDEDPAYVIRLQASFVDGGVLIDFVAHHNVTDGSALATYARFVAMSMNGEEFSEDLLEKANLDRRNLIPLLGPDEPMLDHSHNRRPSVIAPGFMVPARWHWFRFSNATLQKLKEEASQRDGFRDDVAFITTDDAISAFWWKMLSTMRLRRNKRLTPETISKFSRAANGRKLLGIPDEYMGDTVYNISTWLTLGELRDAPLSTIASTMRKRVEEHRTAYHVRSFATFVARESDKSSITYVGPFDPETDIGSSSRLGGNDCFYNFGRLGRPDFARRPIFRGIPSILVMRPRNPDGDCDAVVCLVDEELEQLHSDPRWTDYVEYIG